MLKGYTNIMLSGHSFSISLSLTFEKCQEMSYLMLFPISFCLLNMSFVQRPSLQLLVWWHPFLRTLRLKSGRHNMLNQTFLFVAQSFNKTTSPSLRFGF